MNPDTIKALAEQHGYQLEFHKPENKLLRFSKDGELLVDIWYSTLTVGVARRQPDMRFKYYKNNNDISDIEEILISPGV